MTILVPLLALALKDLRTYRLAFPAAFAMGLLALAVPWFPGMEGGGLNAAEIRLASASAVGFLGACILALLHGISGFPRETAERHLGFFLARPVGLTTLFAGRLLGGLLAALGVAFLTLLPALVSTLFLPPGSWQELTGMPLVLLGATLALLVLGQAAAQALLARSPWLLLDVLALAGTALATFYAIFQLTTYLGWFDPLHLLKRVGWAYVLAALAGGLAALRGGRTDLRRGHRMLSLTVAGLMGTTCIGLGLFTRTHIAWDPAQASIATVSDLPAQGEWIGLTHRRKGPDQSFAFAAFLHHLPSGRNLRLPHQDLTGSLGSETLAFDPQGRHAAWLQPVPSFRPGRHFRIKVADLQGNAARIRTFGSIDNLGSVDNRDLERVKGFQFSPDGALLALLTRDRLRIFDARLGVAVLDRPLPDVSIRDLFFLPGERIRLVQTDRGPSTASSEIREIHIAGGRESVTGRFEPSGRGTWVTAWHPDTDRLLMLDQGPGMRSLHLRDGRTGRTLALVAQAGERDRMDATFTMDGGLAIAEERPEGVQVRLLDPEGRPVRTMAFAAEGRERLRRIVGLDAMGRLLFRVAHPSNEACALLGVDMAKGTLAYRVPGVIPATPSWPRARLQGTAQTHGSPITRFYRNLQGDLLTGDPSGPLRLLHLARRPEATPGP